MKKRLFYAPVGFAAGVANGLFGAGGGTLLVPALEKLIGMETHKAHATALAVILPLSLLSAFIYIQGVPVDWLAVLYVSAGGVAGGLAGAMLLNKLSAGWLHKLFGLFLIAAAVRMIG